MTNLELSSFNESSFYSAAGGVGHRARSHGGSRIAPTLPGGGARVPLPEVERV